MESSINSIIVQGKVTCVYEIPPIFEPTHDTDDEEEDLYFDVVTDDGVNLIVIVTKEYERLYSVCKKTLKEGTYLRFIGKLVSRQKGPHFYVGVKAAHIEFKSIPIRSRKSFIDASITVQEKLKST